MVESKNTLSNRLLTDHFFCDARTWHSQWLNPCMISYLFSLIYFIYWSNKNKKRTVREVFFQFLIVMSHLLLIYVYSWFLHYFLLSEVKLNLLHIFRLQCTVHDIFDTNVAYPTFWKSNSKLLRNGMLCYNAVPMGMLPAYRKWD